LQSLKRRTTTARKNKFYSLQKSRKIGDEWKNESVLLNKEQLAQVAQLRSRNDLFD
jgi:hypothetical protein